MENKRFKILSIAGGGTKGIIPATILSKIEEETGKQCFELFDLIIGTSTGGIIAAALAKGIKSSKLVDLYLNETKNIFTKTTSYNIRSLNGLILPKYQNTGLIQTIKKYLGEEKVSTAKVNFITTAYDTIEDKVNILKSWKEKYKDFSFTDFAVMTASAPTYFPNYKFNVDGGIYANNPTHIAWAEALKLGYNFDEIDILFLGTGEVIRKDNTEKWGKKQWIVKEDDTPIISKSMKGQSQITNYLTELLFKNYVSLDFVIDKSLKDMDSVENVDDLLDLTNKNIINTDKYKKAIEIIVS